MSLEKTVFKFNIHWYAWNIYTLHPQEIWYGTVGMVWYFLTADSPKMQSKFWFGIELLKTLVALSL